MMGHEAGLIFNFESITRAPNTLLAHCLIKLAPTTRQEEVIDAIYDAFFQHGLDVGDLETLLKIAETLDIDPGQLRKQLDDPELRRQVEAEVEVAYKMGISSVPFFVINDQYAFSGAQTPETITRILQQIDYEEERLE